MMKKIHQKLKMIHQKKKMSLKCKHIKAMEIKTYKITNIKVEAQKVEGPITYSTDQQILKFEVNSGTDQEVWGVYIDFQSIHSK